MVCPVKKISIEIKKIMKFIREKKEILKFKQISE